MCCVERLTERQQAGSWSMCKGSILPLSGSGAAAVGEGKRTSAALCCFSHSLFYALLLFNCVV